jgi:hypothetical protein
MIRFSLVELNGAIHSSTSVKQTKIIMDRSKLTNSSTATRKIDFLINTITFMYQNVS